MRSHNDRLEKYAKLFNLPAKELKAIVFPELIRYNMVFDFLQIESLKYLYVTEGKTYADFSVGVFQMKPSFAEMVERDAMTLPDAMFIKNSGIKDWMKADNEDGRWARVRRITNADQQIVYLCAFYKICQRKFGSRRFESATERIRFFATCYNAGYTRSEVDILLFESRNHFYKYNYSAVSTYYFEKG